MLEALKCTVTPPILFAMSARKSRCFIVLPQSGRPVPIMLPPQFRRTRTIGSLPVAIAVRLAPSRPSASRYPNECVARACIALDPDGHYANGLGDQRR